MCTVAYSELVKSFERIRDYMRQFYVYGFKSRGEYDLKSARSYDNERRRIESWLHEYMSFRQDADGKKVFLFVDSRLIPSNPLYKAWKARSFTSGDITFHFYIMDILSDARECSIQEIVDEVAEKYLSRFMAADGLDESTIRKKLKEYEGLGLLSSRKYGRRILYKRIQSKENLGSWKDAVAFYSEENPVGVIGSFLLDKYESVPEYFGFKHHYILHALDSEILCGILTAMSEKRCVDLTMRGTRGGNSERRHTVYPVKIYVSTQSGRAYLLSYHYQFRRPVFFRLDNINRVSAGPVERKAHTYSGWYDRFCENLWGVSVGAEPVIDHIEMIVHIADDEGYIVDRLHREKRCGRVEMPDAQTCVFTADVYDAAEMLPWLRTFIGRIIKLECSDSYLTETFYKDLAVMTSMYGGEGDAV